MNLLVEIGEIGVFFAVVGAVSICVIYLVFGAVPHAVGELNHWRIKRNLAKDGYMDEGDLEDRARDISRKHEVRIAGWWLIVLLVASALF